MQLIAFKKETRFANAIYAHVGAPGSWYFLVTSTLALSVSSSFARTTLMDTAFATLNLLFALVFHFSLVTV